MALLFEELSYQLIGCAQKVHSVLGPGLPEAVYQRALRHEFERQGVRYSHEVPFKVYYDGTLCGEFRLDLLVDDKIILELKAAAALCAQHQAQALAYLNATGMKLALLMNFGEPRLAVKRLLNRSNLEHDA